MFPKIKKTIFLWVINVKLAAWSKWLDLQYGPVMLEDKDCMNTKSVLQSKTFWVNVLGALLPLYPPAGEFVKSSPEIVAAGWALVNIVLRLVTKGSVVIV